MCRRVAICQWLTVDAERCDTRAESAGLFTLVMLYQEEEELRERRAQYELESCVYSSERGLRISVSGLSVPQSKSDGGSYSHLAESIRAVGDALILV